MLACVDSGIDDCPVASPSDHRGTEEQSVEITLALVMGVVDCAAVVLVAWVLRLAARADGRPIWTVATAIAAPTVGLIFLGRQLFRARQRGL